MPKLGATSENTCWRVGQDKDIGDLRSQLPALLQLGVSVHAGNWFGGLWMEGTPAAPGSAERFG